MPSSNVMREFLVAIGFKVDEAKYKSFSNGLKTLTDQFKTFGEVSVATGGALVAEFLKVSASMDKMYYSAIRARTSVSNLMSERFAGSQIGLDADQLTSQIQGVADKLASNPGLYAFFKSNGIPISSDATDNFNNLIEGLAKLSESNPFLAARQGALFGFSPADIKQWQTLLPIFKEQRLEFERMAKEGGVNFNQNAVAFASFNRELGKFEAGVKILAVAFGVKLLPLAEMFVHDLNSIVDWMLKANVATSGWSTVLAGVALTLAGIVSSLTIIKAAGSLIGLGGGATAAAEGAGAGAAAGAAGPLGLLAVIAAAGTYDVVKGKQLYDSYRISGDIKSASDSIASIISKFEGPLKNAAYSDVGGRATIGIGHLIKRGENFGSRISDEAANALFAQDIADAQKTVRNLVKVALTANQMNALTDFAFNVGSGNFAKSTLLKDVNGGDFAGAAAEFQKWDHAGGREVVGLRNRRLGEKAMFTSPNVNLTQKTDINVYGGDARQTSKETANRQKEVNADLLRDATAKVQ